VRGLTAATRTLAGVPTSRTAWLRTPDGGLVGQRTTDLAGPSTTRAYYLTDGLGSVLAVVDQNGTVRNRYHYSPYGETTRTCPTNSCIDNPWRFAGEYHDTQTGLYKIGERYYAPDFGRWTQADPLANRLNPTNPAEANPYAYAACNPINNTDPTGLASDPIACVAPQSPIMGASMLCLL
jgi:RHS repeat-associated protein